MKRCSLCKHEGNPIREDLPTASVFDAPRTVNVLIGIYGARIVISRRDFMHFVVASESVTEAVFSLPSIVTTGGACDADKTQLSCTHSHARVAIRLC